MMKDTDESELVEEQLIPGKTGEHDGSTKKRTTTKALAGGTAASPRDSVLAARCPLRVHEKSVEGLARGHEEPIALRPAEAKVRAALR